MELRSIQDIELIMFADDLAIMVNGTDIEKMELIMNNALKKLSSWVTKNLMEANLDKTKFQLFTMKNNVRKSILCYIIKQETTLQKYLGFTLDQRLTLKHQTNEVFP